MNRTIHFAGNKKPPEKAAFLLASTDRIKHWFSQRNCLQNAFDNRMELLFDQESLTILSCDPFWRLAAPAPRTAGFGILITRRQRCFPGRPAAPAAAQVALRRRRCRPVRRDHPAARVLPHRGRAGHPRRPRGRARRANRSRRSPPADVRAARVPTMPARAPGKNPGPRRTGARPPLTQPGARCRERKRG